MAWNKIIFMKHIHIKVKAQKHTFHTIEQQV